MSESHLRYGMFLLFMIQRESRWRRTTNWDLINNLCDRFERLMALPREPLVWEGDYA